MESAIEMSARRRAILVVLLIIVIGVFLFLVSGGIDRFKLPAHESSAVASLRMIYASNATFAHSHPQQGYALALSQLVSHPEDSKVPEWAINSELGSGERAGYAYRYVPHETRDGKVDAFDLFADPLGPGSRARRHFFLDQTGIIRVSDNGPAAGTSQALN